jgi:FMN phosphatase YigB (HAD superfamily)
MILAMVRSVIFDLGAVLASDEWPLIYKKLSQDLGISEKKAREVMGQLFMRFCRGEFDETTFWVKYGRRAGVEIPSEYPSSFWTETYLQWSEDVSEVWQIAKELGQLGLRLVILSNIDEPHVKANYKMGRVDRLKKIGFEKFFWSCELGMIKSQPQLFEFVLGKLDLAANECIFVDDTEVYTKLAGGLGMRGIHFKSAEQLRRELRKFGIRV